MLFPMAGKVQFNTVSLNAPMSPEDMGRHLLLEACKDYPDFQKALGLIECGATTNVRDDNGFTALMWAVTKGHDDLADAIIQRGREEDYAE